MLIFRTVLRALLRPFINLVDLRDKQQLHEKTLAKKSAKRLYRHGWFERKRQVINELNAAIVAVLLIAVFALGFGTYVWSLTADMQLSLSAFVPGIANPWLRFIFVGGFILFILAFYLIALAAIFWLLPLILLIRFSMFHIMPNDATSETFTENDLWRLRNLIKNSSWRGIGKLIYQGIKSNESTDCD